MRVRHILRSASLVLLAGGIAGPGFAQDQATPGRIPQQIIINGQQANGAYVPRPTGGLQSFTCANPQHYTTVDGSTQGWACYDQRTATYLLNALPPTPSQPAAPPAALPAPLPQTPVVAGPSYPSASYPGVQFPQPRLSGKIKIDTKQKDLLVYVDGGYAGRVRDLKNFSATAGNHDLEVHDSKGETIFKEQVHVLPRQTIEVKLPAK